MTPLLSITADEREAFIAKAIVSREHEIMAYELNIAVYETARLTASREFQNQLDEAIKNEQRECNKCILMRDALRAEIPSTKLAAAIAAAKLP